MLTLCSSAVAIEVYVYYISSSRKKKEKKKKGESKIQTRIKITNVAFLFLSSPGGLLVLREYNYKHLPTDLLRVMGLVGSGL